MGAKPKDQGPVDARVHLVESDDTQPRVRLEVGKRYHVVTTTVVDADLNKITDDDVAGRKKPARLCGSRGTCVAIVEIDSTLDPQRL